MSFVVTRQMADRAKDAQKQTEQREAIMENQEADEIVLGTKLRFTICLGMKFRVEMFLHVRIPRILIWA